MALMMIWSLRFLYDDNDCDTPDKHKTDCGVADIYAEIITEKDPQEGNLEQTHINLEHAEQKMEEFVADKRTMVKVLKRQIRDQR